MFRARKIKTAFAPAAPLSVTRSAVPPLLSPCRSSITLLFAATQVSRLHVPHVIIKASTGAPFTNADKDGELVLEGDVLVYRERESQDWRMGAVVEVPESERYSVRPLCSRSPEEDGSVECFVNWEADSGELSIQSETYEIAIVDADYEERVVQDRLANPHGEVSEDCWRISTQVLESFNVRIPRI